MNLHLLKSTLMNGLVVMNFAGSPSIQLKEDKIKPVIKNNLSLKSDTYVRTHVGDYIVLKINDRYKVTVLPDSIFAADGVRDGDLFNVRSLFIRRGQVHIEQIARQTSSDISLAHVSSADPTEISEYDYLKVETDFFVFNTEKNQKLSLLVDLNLKTGVLNVCNFGNDFKLNLFDHEVDQDLKMNEGVKFLGVVDKSGQIAYDLLLEKRKIPQGKWTAKAPCSFAQIKEIQDKADQLRIKQIKEIEAQRLKKIAAQKANDIHSLCRKPYGKLDQCHFILKQNKCMRERCNAEGKWTDQTEVGITKNLCSVHGEVKSCGY